MFVDGAQRAATDTTETVDGDLDAHRFFSLTRCTKPDSRCLQRPGGRCADVLVCPPAQARTFLTAAATASAVMPKSLNSSPAGADSPKRSMPTTSPSRPTYLRQPSVTPASTATRGRPLGSTPAFQASSWRSKTLVLGMETTRTAMPSPASVFCAETANATSEPVAMITAWAATVCEPLPASDRT
ncbi:Permease protein PstA [Thauera linaloolentis 47Lol = DSM 12138]|uniref:Permease protein PstA n=1 Tax=Thauera linaloolentis (strain DSM 12138 / JCM 21573 / CCUG 41526 / CIP 105981 / IAM 15112 / NBRC 102519 / 47Lol) TaxID=1123367 RepID=N6ZE43_THAL4|nr:Permease protein PstA [Thauera linaloolentis 47Lol = DSM 12138]